MKHQGKSAGAVMLIFSRRAVPRGAFSGRLHVTVEQWDAAAPDSGGLFSSRASPYVTLCMGPEKLSTECMHKAGNANVVFDEVLTLNKHLMDAALRVSVFDKGTVSDSLLGKCTVNVHRLDMAEESDEAVVAEVTLKGQPSGKLRLLLSRRALPKGAFAGPLHVTVDRVDGVKDSAGLFDRTDLYVQLSLGSEKLRTTTKKNSGGSNVIFDEVVTFNKALMDGRLLLEVFDADTLSDDKLGQGVCNLHRLEMQEEHEDDTPLAFHVTLKGEPAGTVYLMFSRRAVPKGAFAGLLHVTVDRISGVADTAGFMDRTDPYVSLRYASVSKVKRDLCMRAL